MVASKVADGESAHLYQSQPSATAGMQEFEVKTYDVTSFWESGFGLLFSCGINGWMKRILVLDKDEAIMTTTNNCMNNVRRAAPAPSFGHQPRALAASNCTRITAPAPATEAPLRAPLALGPQIQKRPYAQLGAVDSANAVFDRFG